MKQRDPNDLLALAQVKWPDAHMNENSRRVFTISARSLTNHRMPLELEFNPHDKAFLFDLCDEKKIDIRNTEHGSWITHKNINMKRFCNTPEGKAEAILDVASEILKQEKGNER